MLAPISDILQVAVRISRENRTQICTELGGCVVELPTAAWDELASGRRADGTCKSLADASKQLVRLADGELRPYVKRAVKRLCDAVAALDGFRPEYAKMRWEFSASVARRFGLLNDEREWCTWEPTAASVARLDELRNNVKVKLIELDSLFGEYVDGLARALAVAKRIAGVVLEPTQAARAVKWLEKLEREEEAVAG